MKKVLEIMGILAILFLGWIGGSFFPLRCLKSPENGQIQRDTVVVVDTVRVVSPPEVRYVRTTDTLLVSATDTIRVNDTLYVALPREEREYADSLFKAQVSGVAPRLDWIEVYPRTVTITEKISMPVVKRWGVGVHVGYGVALSNPPRFAPYVGVGVQYNLLSW